MFKAFVSKFLTNSNFGAVWALLLKLAIESFFTSLAELSSHCLADLALVMVSSVVKVCNGKDSNSTCAVMETSLHLLSTSTRNLPNEVFLMIRNFP